MCFAFRVAGSGYEQGVLGDLWLRVEGLDGLAIVVALNPQPNTLESLSAPADVTLAGAGLLLRDPWFRVQG